VPSSVAGTAGLAVTVSTPTKARFSSGKAPVVVAIAGGWSADGMTVADGYQLENAGFVVVQFNFPGGGKASTASGGTFDTRGVDSLAAVRDVAKFAMGLLADTNGKFIKDHTGTVTPSTTNIGLLGASNGGNATISTAAFHGASIPALKWILNWESPLGDGAAMAEAGAKGGSQNPTYNDQTGVFDYAKLKYASTLNVVKNGTAVNGGFYLDLNGNGAFDTGSDFQTHPLFNEGKTRAYYSVGMAAAATQKGIFPATPPAHLAGSAETMAWWTTRDAANNIKQALVNFPNLLFIVEASAEDHVQVAADHPHVFAQYDGMRTNGGTFVRLCADRAYVEAAAGKSVPTAVDNNANAAFTRATLRSNVNPETVQTALALRAAASELADRAETGNKTTNLTTVITP
jgi:hypothetical protein